MNTLTHGLSLLDRALAELAEKERAAELAELQEAADKAGESWTSCDGYTYNNIEELREAHNGSHKRIDELQDELDAMAEKYSTICEHLLDGEEYSAAIEAGKAMIREEREKAAKRESDERARREEQERLWREEQDRREAERAARERAESVARVRELVRKWANPSARIAWAGLKTPVRTDRWGRSAGGEVRKGAMIEHLAAFIITGRPSAKPMPENFPSATNWGWYYDQAWEIARVIKAEIRDNAQQLAA